jgi:nicotinate-nucleotide pyrophosphorylase (carboxylating)
MPDDFLALPTAELSRIVKSALHEDLPWGDITSDYLVPSHARAVARLVVQDDGVVSGLPVAKAVFAFVDPDICFRDCVREASSVPRGTVAAEAAGAARSILKAERTALNLMQRMSGIATTTAQYVEAVKGTGATIVDTRKTAPGLRSLDKYAVRCGGGSNHRFSLSDAALVKDNHLAVLGEMPVEEALRALRARMPHTTKLEVEVEHIDQIEAVLAGGADIILLDNMSPTVLREAVESIRGRALTEASGGVTLSTVRAVAEAGVNLISIGALTHSVRALNISLEMEPA